MNMKQIFTMAPRYRQDDKASWLEGIDPCHYYWIAVNGDNNLKVAIPGLIVSSIAEWKENLRRWRSLQGGDRMTIERMASICTIHCINENCYAIDAEVAGAKVWHLFDREALESLLMTSHPDWASTPKNVVASQILAGSWEFSAVA